MQRSAARRHTAPARSTRKPVGGRVATQLVLLNLSTGAAGVVYFLWADASFDIMGQVWAVNGG